MFVSCGLAVRTVAAGTMGGKVGVSKADVGKTGLTCLACCAFAYLSSVEFGGNRWHQSGRENGRDWKARPALQKKLERQAASVV